MIRKLEELIGREINRKTLGIVTAVIVAVMALVVALAIYFSSRINTPEIPEIPEIPDQESSALVGVSSKVESKTEVDQYGYGEQSEKEEEQKEELEYIPEDVYIDNDFPEKSYNGSFVEFVNKFKAEKNSDVIGWIKMPDSNLSQPVLWYKGDQNEYYYRKDLLKKYSLLGVVFADFRSEFGAGIPRNTVLYGHNVNDDKEGQMFASLKKLENREFAEKTPYIYFSTGSADYIFEIFAVSYTSAQIAYNNPNFTDEQQAEIIKDMKQKSVHKYNVDVVNTDKIITLSTCTYTVPGLGRVEYPSDHRFVVMGKLVSSKTKTVASLD